MTRRKTVSVEDKITINHVTGKSSFIYRSSSSMLVVVDIDTDLVCNAELSPCCFDVDRAHIDAGCLMQQEECGLVLLHFYSYQDYLNLVVDKTVDCVAVLVDVVSTYQLHDEDHSYLVYNACVQEHLILQNLQDKKYMFVKNKHAMFLTYFSQFNNLYFVRLRMLESSSR